MSKKDQTRRLTIQQKSSQGAVGIFGEEAQNHDNLVGFAELKVKDYLEEKYNKLKFRHRNYISKKEINIALQKIDVNLGQTLFVEDSNIKPDGGILEVMDDNGEWRIILVCEAKYQGKDIDNIKNGIQVGKNNDQDLMVAGNAIERSHKNISEIANYMLGESYFPYVLFLEGTNFLTKNVTIKRPDGRNVTLNYNSGSLNRLDRLTSANYGMPINSNLCENKFVKSNDRIIMLQAASIYTQGNGEQWKQNEMLNIMIDIAETSIKCLAKFLFVQLTGKR